ncbi:NAD(P)-dependent oxidoreductase [Dictyobacter alpinus]|uniref:NAD(P)-dependent oxidoreductase n=1 Tax=Dictyobacter alpinus TaxID=2014873 RepID=A0A402B627_9CHLR|nr:SDR family oxidoreductase [Dictyobacter alpinus]GCE26806.1 NAD(P)-dependent oxidoreductase [Dictyobacter alpinus]
MLQDKVVVVTGASRGIGKAIAQAFCAQQARVVLVARSIGELEELEDSLLASGADVLAVPTDISQPTAIQELQREIRRHYGTIDILINNAAVAVLKPLVESSTTERAMMIDVNLHAMFDLTQTFLPEMIERHSGIIINISAAVARNGYPNLAVYSATKAAIITFGEALSKEVRRYGVQVYTICPHGVDTTLYRNLFGATGQDKLLTPEAIAQTVLKVVAGEGGIRSGQMLEVALS